MMSIHNRRKARRIDQILPSFGQFDAIGTEANLIRSLIRSQGFESDIFAETSWSFDDSRPILDYADLANDDCILLHHFSIGSQLPFFIYGKKTFVVTRYHNVTPAAYFSLPFMWDAYLKCHEGRLQLPIVREQSDAFWPVSQFNTEDFGGTHAGMLNRMPVLRHYERLSQGIPSNQIDSYLQRNLRKTMLFVGRVVPNKGQHDLLHLLSLYRRFVSRDLRLILVGGHEPHYANVVLPCLAKELDLSISIYPKEPQDFDADVILSGMVPDDQMVSYYRNSDVFVSLSDHEGFGVPLVEAMHFNLPLLCHRAAAVPETVGEAAMLVDKQNMSDLLQKVHALLHNQGIRQKYIDAAREKSRDYSWTNLKAAFDSGFRQLLEYYG